jgi:superfamily I DNA/RNA helicase
MDSPIVIVLGAETFIDKFEDQDETKLMYVALTRAREYLVMLYTGNEGLVPQLKYCQEQYNKYRESIIEHIEQK